MKNLKTLTYILISTLAFACGPKDEPTVVNKYFTQAEIVSEGNRDKVVTDLKTAFGENSSTATFIQGFVRYGLKQVRINYKTKNTDGTEITASGALFLPISTGTKETFPLASIQHGTIFDQADAPSLFNLRGESVTGLVLASTGYIVAMPDYIGYGKSANLPHPYEHRESLAQSSLDMLRAVKEYIAQEKIAWNSNTYLGGYSEGGFATMSMLKKMEETAATEFTIKAASLGSGAYDKTAFTKFVTANKTTPQAQFNSSYIWVLLTYDAIYNLKKPMSYYFKEPYATQITTSKHLAQITVPMQDILQDAFKKSVNDGADMAFVNAIKDNDVYDWKPVTQTRLYHGTADDYVYFFNSQNAFDAMRKRGATNVNLIPLNGKNHSTAVQDFLLGTIEFFGNNL